VTEGIFAVLYVSMWALHVFIKQQFFYIYLHTITEFTAINTPAD